MDDPIRITVNGRPVVAPAGSTVAVAVLLADSAAFRRSVLGEPRGPLCGMGVCFECRATIDGEPHCRTCQTICVEGMEVQTDATF
jgi:D-hydroxyproline dehydrogenase subunit gamma